MPSSTGSSNDQEESEFRVAFTSETAPILYPPKTRSVWAFRTSTRWRTMSVSTSKEISSPSSRPGSTVSYQRTPSKKSRVPPRQRSGSGLWILMSSASRPVVR